MTPHIEAKNGDYADIVLMPGDPLRATFIAETYLTDVKKINSVRGCFGYTGIYNDIPVSVQASGMGQASLAIYATELFNVYNVGTIIRIGTCGSFHENINIGDVVVALTASADHSPISNFNFSPHCDYKLLRSVLKSINEQFLYYNIGSVYSTDYFYRDDTEFFAKLRDLNIIGIDMETYMLYYLAMKHNKKALTVNLVSDNIFKGIELSSEERVKKVDKMTKAVLESL